MTMPGHLYTIFTDETSTDQIKTKEPTYGQFFRTLSYLLLPTTYLPTLPIPSTLSI